MKEQDLANILQHPYSRLQIPNMKYRERQFDIAEMSIAFSHGLAASLANFCFAGYAHARVKCAIFGGKMVASNVSKGAIAHFEDALLQYILIRAFRFISSASESA